MLLTFDELPRPTSAAPLAIGAVDLWSFAYEGFADHPELIPAYEALMSPDERERCAGLVRESDRTMFRATRALVRTTLSRYTDVAPHQWQFARSPAGRPYSIGPRMERRLYFSLSNTAGLILCAVSRHASIGVDVELVDPNKQIDRLAQNHFSPQEVRALRELPMARRIEQFYAYWTLKESYVKAKGVGLALPLDRFSLLLDEERSPKIRFDPRLADNSTRWRFVRIAATADEFDRMIAIAVDTGGAALTLRGTSCVPLRPQDLARSAAEWRRSKLENSVEVPTSDVVISTRYWALKIDD